MPEKLYHYQFFNYWGKSVQTDKSNIIYHLLPYHGLDVAAVGWELLAPQKKMTQSLAASLMVEPNWLRQWMCFCLSLHDLGKFSAAFQGLAPEIVKQLSGVPVNLAYSERHDSLGNALWRDCLSSKWRQNGQLDYGIEDRQWSNMIRGMDPWLEIVTGHHGVPPKVGNIHCQNFFTAENEDAAMQYLLAVADLFLDGLDCSCLADKKLKKRLKQSSWALAGLVVLADWMGSAVVSDVWRQAPVDLGLYWENHALPFARQTVPTTLLTPVPIAPFSGISSLFSFITNPTPLQQWAAQIELANSPQLFILEDVTGAGKTEAALTLAHRIMASGLAHGLYVALPTMATANAMYERLGKAYRRLFAKNAQPSLILAHGARHLSSQFQHSIGLMDALPTGPSSSKIDEDSSLFCHAWLADSRKKALLAEVGVGTVDQALIGALPARHQSLRLLGLRGKVLVVDEVHAYDPYMNQLLQTLLQAHAQQGGSAILLSATLPHGMKKAFADAFCSDLNHTIPYPLVSLKYPLATQLGADVRSETPISARFSSKRTVEVRMLNKIGEVETVIQAALDAGQCVCWIRNTVRDARDAYDELIGREWIDPHRLHLFHSRFAMVDRQCIETQTLNWFGKSSKTAQRQGRLLLATQVVEQSLDLDFDVLVTDIAPIDLLIQRAGRLHRHPRSRDGAPATVEKRETPILYIYGPAPTQTPTETWLRDVLPGTQAVYPNVGQIWLTQQCLLKSGCIQTPDMCRQLIESVYGLDCPNEIPESLQDLTMDAEGEDAGKRSMARINRLTLSRGYTRGSAENVNGWDEDTRIPTRLGRETVRVALSRIEADRLVPYARTDEHAWEMSMLNLPKEEWQRVCAAIPPHIQQMISQIKDSEAVLKWAEVLPICDQIPGYYHARAGWFLRKERK